MAQISTNILSARFVHNREFRQYLCYHLSIKSHAGIEPVFKRHFVYPRVMYVKHNLTASSHSHRARVLKYFVPAIILSDNTTRQKAQRFLKSTTPLYSVIQGSVVFRISFYIISAVDRQAVDNIIYYPPSKIRTSYYYYYHLTTRLKTLCTREHTTAYIENPIQKGGGGKEHCASIYTEGVKWRGGGAREYFLGALRATSSLLSRRRKTVQRIKEGPHLLPSPPPFLPLCRPSPLYRGRRAATLNRATVIYIHLLEAARRKCSPLLVVQCTRRELYYYKPIITTLADILST